MRKFTLLIIGLVFAGFFTTTKAQDVGITDIPLITAGQTIYPNLPTLVNYTRQNFGATALSPGVDYDSLIIEITVGGVEVQVCQRGATTPFAPGAAGAETFSCDGTSIDWSTAGIPAGLTAVCVRTNLRKNGVYIDVNNSNDETCKTVTYSGDNNPFTYDFALENVVLKDIFNTYTDGQTLPAGFALVDLGFDLKNNSSFQVDAGITFQIEIVTGGVTYGPYGGTAPGMSPGGVTPFTLANPGIVLPTTSPAEVCMNLVATPDDTDNSNDEDCSSFLLPTGIEEASVEYFEMNYFNRTLSINMLENINGPVQVSVISVGGQEVYSEVYEATNGKKHEVNLNQLNSGVFIAKIIAENGIVETTRFVVE